MSDFNKKEYDQKYMKENYKRVSVHLPFEFAEEIDNHIIDTNEKRNTFIKRAVIETIEEMTGKELKLKK